MNWYGILKLLHVLAAIVWIGGATTIALVVFRLAGTRDRGALGSVVPQVNAYMLRAAGPSAGTVLITGIAMVLVGHLTFKSLWIGLGIAGLIILGAFGGAVMSKRMTALQEAAANGSDGALAQAGAGVRQASVILLLIMAAIIAIMVLKPTL